MSGHSMRGSSIGEQVAMTARFGYEFRRATNEDSPPGRRVIALKRLVESYSALSGLRYAQIWRLVAGALEFGESVRYPTGPEHNAGARWPTGTEINAVAHLLKQQRDRLLSELRQFDATRRDQKTEGKRHPSRRQTTELYSHAWLPPPAA